MLPREALSQLQGQMGIILEHLQVQTDNAIVVNLTDTNVTNTALVVVDSVDTVVQPVVVNQSLFQDSPNRFVAAYPWGMPHNYTPQFASVNPFVPYQSFVVSSSNGNYVAFPYGMPNHFFAQGVETKEAPQPVVNVNNAEDQ